MYRIALVNPPFGDLATPSIGLTQLKAVLRERFGSRVRVDVHYLNLDLAGHLGWKHYQQVYQLDYRHKTGVGDWLFRHEAFPQIADNRDHYIPHLQLPQEASPVLKEWLGAIQARISDWLNQVVRRAEWSQYDLIGLTSTAMQNMATFAMARRLKTDVGSRLLVMGGANCESSMGQAALRNVPDIDYVFSGPALESFPCFVARAIEGQNLTDPAIPGVISRGAMIKDLRAMVGEDTDINRNVDLEYDDYFEAVRAAGLEKHVRPVVLFETSRGCWWGERSQCSFCGLNSQSMRFRAMSPGVAVAHLQKVFRYADRARQYLSADNVIPQAYFREMLPNLRPPGNIELFYEVRATMTDEEFDAVAATRVTVLLPGLEALSTETLKQMRKGTTVFDNLRFLLRAAQRGISVHWGIIIGNPGENEAVYERYAKVMPALYHLAPPRAVTQLRYDRYSRYFLRPEEYGLQLEPADFYQAIYPFPAQDLRDLAYYFRDLNAPSSRTMVTQAWLGRLRPVVEEWSRRHKGADGREPARLIATREGDGILVRDTRGGACIERHLGGRQASVLEALGQPKSADALGKMLGTADPQEVKAILVTLQEWGMVFHENERYLNLVVFPLKK